MAERYFWLCPGQTDNFSAVPGSELEIAPCMLTTHVVLLSATCLSLMSLLLLLHYAVEDVAGNDGSTVFTHY